MSRIDVYSHGDIIHGWYCVCCNTGQVDHFGEMRQDGENSGLSAPPPPRVTTCGDSKNVQNDSQKAKYFTEDGCQ